jgi:hypothetical protein
MLDREGGVGMPTWGWVLIALTAVVVGAGVVWQWTVRKRTERLRGQFGAEYDRVVESADTRREAEAELLARTERREQFEVRPLSASSREEYGERWRGVQAQFVDDPRAAVVSADSVIQSVMRECGYPVEEFDQRASDLSVDHPGVVEHYREGHRVATQGARDGDPTEDLRRAMQHYRALFEELVDSSSNATDSTSDSRRVGAGKET